MSILSHFVLLCALLLVITQSSAIKEAPENEKSSLEQGNDETSSLSEQMPAKDSTVVLREQNATASDLSATYCSRFDNSCVDCLNSGNCTMIRYTNKTTKLNDVEEIVLMFQCYDENASLKQIKEAFKVEKVDFILATKDCPKVSPMQVNQENENKEATEAVVTPTAIDVNITTDQNTSSSVSDNTTTTTTNATTKTSTTSNTTVTTPTTTVTTITSTTPANTTTMVTTNSTTSYPTSATNSTQPPITSKDPPPPPSSGGWSFWSFFGGILLTLGLSAIGFVGFKYYKARSVQSGGGLNYNRF